MQRERPGVVSELETSGGAAEGGGQRGSVAGTEAGEGPLTHSDDLSFIKRLNFGTHSNALPELA